jgi:diphthamide biosynthesis protein 3
MSETETVYDQIEIEDFTYDPDTQLFTYPCPCGDRFQISIYDMQEGENIAVCPSCSLMCEIIFDELDLQQYTDQL